jgi:hypothetical protein
MAVLEAVGAASDQKIGQREAIASRRRASSDEKRILMAIRLRHFAPDGREFLAPTLLLRSRKGP